MFHSATLKAVLSANEKLKHLEEQLVPHMIRYQVGSCGSYLLGHFVGPLGL